MQEKEKGRHGFNRSPSSHRELNKFTIAQNGEYVLFVLCLQVENERTSVLKHPIVRSYIYEKWKTLGLWWYLSFFALFLLFISSLALFSILIPHFNECRGNNTNMSAGDEDDMLLEGKYNSYTVFIVI